MQHLLRKKIVSTVICIMILQNVSFAQNEIELNLPEHDQSQFHFGISLGTNRAYYHFNFTPRFFDPLNNDSVLVVESLQSTGINLAWLVNMRLSDHFDLRTYPLNLVFTEKAFQYHLKYPDRLAKEDSITTRKVQGITMSLPFQLKFSSDRINNFKVYMLGGGKLEYDFAANAGEKNTEKQIKLNKLDYGIEAGVGFHFYFPVFVFSPEIKLGWGFKNAHVQDPYNKFSNVIDQIKSRTITLSLIVE